ncbi:hypothetical protein AWW66_18915 [Micromonospora rosaria]|uniref:Uncharacterized protein n=1 Tax=Micromonospora rosaria TaxID=47874 RepID=A0A136PPQ0_9ACTN|nr:hypothetical protein AWW66_18915 [Micromonospora rosaria]
MVATGAADLPARRLYARLNFRLTGEREVVPGLRVAEGHHLTGHRAPGTGAGLATTGPAGPSVGWRAVPAVG